MHFEQAKKGTLHGSEPLTSSSKRCRTATMPQKRHLIRVTLLELLLSHSFGQFVSWDIDTEVSFTTRKMASTPKNHPLLRSVGENLPSRECNGNVLECPPG